MFESLEKLTARGDFRFLFVSFVEFYYLVNVYGDA
jgi:hypothetical protein